MREGAVDQPERTILETRQHWISVGLWWRLAVFAIVLVGGWVVVLPLAPLMALPLVVADVVVLIFIVALPYIRWRSHAYRLTDRRLVLEEGLLVRRSKTIPLARLQDVSTEVGVLGRIVGYGSVKVENAGESPGHDLLKDIPAPERFRDLLLGQAGQARQADL